MPRGGGRLPRAPISVHPKTPWPVGRPQSRIESMISLPAMYSKSAAGSRLLVEEPIRAGTDHAGCGTRMIEAVGLDQLQTPLPAANTAQSRWSWCDPISHRRLLVQPAGHSRSRPRPEVCKCQLGNLLIVVIATKGSPVKTRRMSPAVNPHPPNPVAWILLTRGVQDCPGKWRPLHDCRSAQPSISVIRFARAPLRPSGGRGRGPWRIGDAPPDRRAHARAERGGRVRGSSGEVLFKASALNRPAPWAGKFAPRSTR